MKINKDIYFSEYDHKARFASYFHQIRNVREFKPRTVLEIGVGNGTVSDYLRKRYNLTTFDIDQTLSPDVVGTVLDMPFKNKQFDVAVCAEVLEHLPYENFGRALKEIARVSKAAVISLPDHRFVVINISIKLPFIKKFGLFIKCPTFKEHKFDGQHYWEIGKKGFPPKKIIQEIKDSGFIIKRCFVPNNAPMNYFFILESVSA